MRIQKSSLAQYISLRKNFGTLFLHLSDWDGTFCAAFRQYSPRMFFEITPKKIFFRSILLVFESDV